MGIWVENLEPGHLSSLAGRQLLPWHVSRHPGGPFGGHFGELSFCKTFYENQKYKCVMLAQVFWGVQERGLEGSFKFP